MIEPFRLTQTSGPWPSQPAPDDQGIQPTSEIEPRTLSLSMHILLSREYDNKKWRLKFLKKYKTDGNN